MPKRFFDDISNWAGGVNTSAKSDTLPLGTSPRGRNSALTSISPLPASAVVSTRKGSRLVIEPVFPPSSTSYIAQHFFSKSNGDQYHVLINSIGTVEKRLANDTVQTIAGVVFTTGGDTLPAFAVANDLLFICNGIEAKKFDGTDVTDFGLDQPPTPTVSGTGAGAVISAGDWDVLLTHYNSNTGHESQISDSASVTLTPGQALRVQWTDPSDDQVTHTRVYIRQQALGPNFYLLVSDATPAPDGTHFGFAPGVTATDINVPDSVYENLTILSPEVNKNFPPPSGAKSPTWHKSRMFVHDGASLYWSDIEKPEAFNLEDAVEPVNPDDGDEIVALHSTDDILLIFKRKSTWALVGDDPASWSLENINNTIGAVNQQCIVSQNALTCWWDGQKGPIAWVSGGSPEPIGIPLIGPTIDLSVLNETYFHNIIAAADNHPQRQRILWAVPEASETVNNLILPFNTILRVWESDGWNPYDVYSMASFVDYDGVTRLYAGGFGGKLYEVWNGTHDGIHSSQLREGLLTNASTTTVLTCTDSEGASPGWTADRLIGAAVYVISQDGEVQRRRVSDNSATTITVDTALESAPNSTYTFILGGIDFAYDTGWVHSGTPFYKKRYEFLLTELAAETAGVEATIEVFLDGDEINARRTNVQNLGTQAVYGEGIYGTDTYATTEPSFGRYRMSKTGKSWRVRVRSLSSEAQFAIHKLAMQSILLSHKS